jgi:hypothetical protein
MQAICSTPSRCSFAGHQTEVANALENAIRHRDMQLAHGYSPALHDASMASQDSFETS